MGFRERTKEMRKDLQERTQENIDRGEDWPEYGTIFIKNKVPTGVGFWKAEFGDHLIDLIPFVAGPGHPRVPEGRMAYNVDVWVHQNVGPTYDQFVCTNRMYKIPDPICNYLRANRNLPKPVWESYRPKRRTVYLVWVHDTPEEEEKGLQIWEFAWWNFEKTIDEIAKNPKGGAPVPFSDYDIGKQIAFSIKKSGTFTDAGGKERDSSDVLGHRFVDRDAKIPDSILDQSFSLDTCITTKPEFEHMEESFGAQQAAPATEGEEKPPEDEEKPPVGDPPGEAEPEKRTADPPATDPPATDPPAASPAETSSAGFECPGGGTPGVDIEKLPECNKCPNYDPCSKLADTGGKAPTAQEEKPPSEAKERKRIVRRRR